MTQWDKLISKLLNLSKDLRFNELKIILESYNYRMKSPGAGSSHFTFRKPGCAPITIPKHEPIKLSYVRLVKEVVESEENEHENN